MPSIDEQMMGLALAEAKKGWGRTSPNPMVGAVVVKDGRIVSKGYHARAGQSHAEAAALRQAGDAAKGATLYVTLEPCHHYGKTPPCTDAILKAGIVRVVYGQKDPNPHVAGGGADYLSSMGVSVTGGIRKDQAEELNLHFTKFITTGLPFVWLKSASTLDGKLATRTGHSRWITGEKARRFVHHLRDGVDAILVGRGTVSQDDPTLNTRLPGRKTGKDPIRIVLDTHMSLAPESRVFQAELGGQTILAVSPESALTPKAEKFRQKGVSVWPIPLREGRVSMRLLLEKMGQEQITSLLVEGGGEINYSALLVESVVDRIIFFYAPKIVGGKNAPTLCDGEGLDDMDQALDLDVLRTRRMGSDLMIEAIPRYRRE